MMPEIVCFADKVRSAADYSAVGQSPANYPFIFSISLADNEWCSIFGYDSYLPN